MTTLNNQQLEVHPLVEKYRTHDYKFTVPPVTHAAWSELDWARFIDSANGWLGQKELNQRFSIANPVDTPMIETDYYLWLTAKAPNDIHSVETKKEYLIDRFGFVLDKSSINPKHLSTLKHIEDWYFDRVIRPTIELGTI